MLRKNLECFLENNDTADLFAKVQEDRDGVKWARTKHGPVCGKEVKDGRCYGCDEELSFVKEHYSHRNGIQHKVKSYYRHTKHQERDCSGETQIHRAAKHGIVTHFHNLNFKYSCYYCKTKHKIDFGDRYESIAEEEVTWKDYRFDVGILQNNKVTGCVEVFKTHALHEQKIDDLTNLGLVWCEVRAEDILNSLERNESEIIVYKCAADVCSYCMLSEKERLLKELQLEYQKESDECQTKIREKTFTDFKNSKELIEYQSLQYELHKLQKDMDVSKEECLQNALKESKKMCQQIDTLKKLLIKRNQEVQEELCKSDEFLKQKEIQIKWEEYKKHIISYAAKVARDLKLPENESELYTMKIIEGKDILEKTVLNFGKYKGALLEDLLHLDFSYLVWLANDSDHVPTNMKQKAKQLINGHCHECGELLRNKTGEEWKTYCKGCYSTSKRRKYY